MRVSQTGPSSRWPVPRGNVSRQIFSIEGLTILRSAHLYLIAVLLTLGVLVGCGTTGGTGGGVIGFDPIAATPTVTSFVLSPKNTTLNAAQTVQLSLTATLSNGQIVNGASLATFVSSNPNLVTVAAGGLATGELPGTATITATIGGVSDTATVTVNPFTDRLFVCNLAGNTITVFDPNATGDVVPLRTYAGNNTQLTGPTQMAVAGQELFVSNTNGSVTVYNLHTQGDVAPKRRIIGPATGLTQANGIAIFNNEIYVANAATPASISVFPLMSNGDATPTRVISGANTLLSQPRNLSVLNNEIFAAEFTGNRILTFPTNATGNVAPVREISGNNTQLNAPIGMLAFGTEIFNDNGGSVTVFNNTDTGNVAPIRRIAGAATGINDPRGLFARPGELFQSEFGNQRVNVFNINANGNALPLRTIVGPNTLMQSPTGVLIAQSVI